ncbi:hypothetical protein Emtol_0446 [Emticicia oligotrophica DSM 17448]|uniref:Lipoprotein n=1 Tax=Emticicia oligotrophica (strain DSM 17448 / CIP 109782 / MTCC 6937 / GPTSA100-15) TaxID=929562 RepID=A0ABM5MWP0_EMTOG|nr:hypothetical protein [Emticicia oligotrophica]AFK01600.1 hypothetical protein Emtol_0446 [Emticicia oligotrophica DSM 17448]
MKSIIYASLISFLLFACNSKKQENTTDTTIVTDTLAQVIDPSTETNGEILAFGFTNENGNKVIAFEEGMNSQSLTNVIDNHGNNYELVYENIQKGNENGVNLIPSNFNDCAGEVYKLKGNKKLNPDYSTVLVNAAFLETRKTLPIKSFNQPEQIDESNKLSIQNDKKRKIKQAWKIAEINNQQAFIVIFEPKKDSVLASLVIGGEKLIYRDYPAKYDEGSTWRVDDGGEFPNDAIKIIGAFLNANNELEIVIDWQGAEGANIEYARANSNVFETVKEGARYWGAL